jgi:hypothetical protein
VRLLRAAAALGYKGGVWSPDLVDAETLALDGERMAKWIKQASEAGSST